MALSYSNVKLSKWPGLKSQWITVPSWYFDVFSINFALQKFNNTLITVDVSYSILWSLNIHSKRQARKSPRLVTSNDIEPNVLPNRDESVEDIYDEIGPPRFCYFHEKIASESCLNLVLGLVEFGIQLVLKFESFVSPSRISVFAIYSTECMTHFKL